MNESWAVILIDPKCLIDGEVILAVDAYGPFDKEYAEIFQKARVKEGIQALLVICPLQPTMGE